VITQRILDSGEIEAFRSEYLSVGYKQDEVHLGETTLKDGSIESFFSVDPFHLAGDGQFHLSVPVGTLVVSALALIYSHVDSGFTSKVSEVYLRSFAIVCRRAVRTPIEIPVKLSVQRRLAVSTGNAYFGTFDIGAGSFTGEGSFLLPVS
jgi:hypothetical protein